MLGEKANRLLQTFPARHSPSKEADSHLQILTNEAPGEWGGFSASLRPEVGDALTPEAELIIYGVGEGRIRQNSGFGVEDGSSPPSLVWCCLFSLKLEIKPPSSQIQLLVTLWPCLYSLLGNSRKVLSATDFFLGCVLQSFLPIFLGSLKVSSPSARPVQVCSAFCSQGPPNATTSLMFWKVHITFCDISILKKNLVRERNL